MTIKIICAWCRKFIGVKPGGEDLITHSICEKCREDVRKEVVKYKKTG